MSNLNKYFIQSKFLKKQKDYIFLLVEVFEVWLNFLFIMVIMCFKVGKYYIVLKEFIKIKEFIFIF